jgi:hypothetical protein
MISLLIIMLDVPKSPAVSFAQNVTVTVPFATPDHCAASVPDKPQVALVIPPSKEYHVAARLVALLISSENEGGFESYNVPPAIPVLVIVGGGIATTTFWQFEIGDSPLALIAVTT